MRLRQATETDVLDLIKMAQETIKQVCIKDYSSKQVQAWSERINRPERFKEAITEQYFIVLEIENKIVGFGSLLNCNYIDFIYVHPNYPRMGIASKIYNRLIIKAQAAKQKTLTSDVSITGRPFFESKGFKVVKEQENKIDDTVLVNFKMNKKLL